MSCKYDLDNLKITNLLRLWFACKVIGLVLQLAANFWLIAAYALYVRESCYVMIPLYLLISGLLSLFILLVFIYSSLVPSFKWYEQWQFAL